MKRRRVNKHRACGVVLPCGDCSGLLAIFGNGGLFGSAAIIGDWFMVKKRVWRRGQLAGKCRFLCVPCLEGRIGRKLSAADFSRSAKVNFLGKRSAVLRKRMRGLKPAKRLIETTFNPMHENAS